VVRLNCDGRPDGSFNPGATGLADDPSFPKPQVVTSIAVQTDGKILVAGRFHTLAGQPRPRIGRLNGDGSLDTSFNAAADDSPSSVVVALVVQSDGKILIAGEVNTVVAERLTNMRRFSAA